ncbi:hypothetical protein ABIE13_000356 [Ottowia thiooxydans]|uniref:Uncharacterized protein n=1 Tax=Ottowia thiooxydans TaxID=219182 RepID=A0ABV2Q2K4_9BURK
MEARMCKPDFCVVVVTFQLVRKRGYQRQLAKSLKAVLEKTNVSIECFDL